MLGLQLGDRTYDLTHRALVMGILNRTPDSFYDKGLTYELDALCRRAEQLVSEGADILDVGGVKAGPGPEVTESEEIDRVVGADRDPVGPLRGSASRWTRGGPRWPRSPTRPVRCWATTSAVSAIPEYLEVAAAAGASVVATHIRLTPRVPDPEPVYDDLVADVRSYLEERTTRAREAGIAPARVVIDAGLDLGKTPEQSLVLLRASEALASLGYPLLLSASNKTFLGKILGLEIDERRGRVARRSRARDGPRMPDRAGARRGRDGPGPRRGVLDPRGALMTPASKDASGGEVRTFLVRGDDPSLVAQEARVLIDRLVGSVASRASWSRSTEPRARIST